MFTQSYSVKALDKKTRKEFLFQVEAKRKSEIEVKLDPWYIVQEIRRNKTDLEKTLERLTLDPVNKSDVLRVLEFLAKALGRGVRLKKALEFILASEEKKSVQLFLQKMLDRLQEQFSNYYDIFKEFPEHFDEAFLGVVRAGESTGTLPENILQHIEEQKKMDKQRAEIQAVFVKRGILFSVVMLVAMVIVTFVIPQFTKLFEKAPHIPAILTILNAIANFLKSYGPFLIVGIVVGVITFIVLFKQNYQFKKTVDRFLLKIPIVSDIIRTHQTCQYLYFTGTLLMKNVNYVKIMDILIEQTSNLPFKEVFEIMRENIVRGVRLQDMLKRSEENLKTNYQKIPQGYLLPSLTQALEMGAATGNMGQILYDAFLAYEVILHQKIKKGIGIFDKVFYAFIIVLMAVLFFAMGAAMMALYKNAGKMI